MTDGTYAEGVTFHSPGFAATPRTPGNAVHGDMVTPTGLDNRPTCMAMFVLHERSVRGHHAFVKPRWGLDSAWGGLVSKLKYPHEESNLELGFRKASLYPFNYEGYDDRREPEPAVHQFSRLEGFAEASCRCKQNATSELKVLRLLARFDGKGQA